MKYQTPELTALTPAINAIQTLGTGTKTVNLIPDSSTGNDFDDSDASYMDWED